MTNSKYDMQVTREGKNGVKRVDNFSGLSEEKLADTRSRQQATRGDSMTIKVTKQN